jgi:hypothetical protein
VSSEESFAATTAVRRRALAPSRRALALQILGENEADTVWRSSQDGPNHLDALLEEIRFTMPIESLLKNALLPALPRSIAGGGTGRHPLTHLIVNMTIAAVPSHS